MSKSNAPAFISANTVLDFTSFGTLLFIKSSKDFIGRIFTIALYAASPTPLIAVKANIISLSCIVKLSLPIFISGVTRLIPAFSTNSLILLSVSASP